jgi:hypothetical protein
MRSEKAKGTMAPGERTNNGSEPELEVMAAAEDRDSEEMRERRERALDKTVADSFPTSDPPSTIPDPAEEDPLAA